jgi:hypothetical protein
MKKVLIALGVYLALFIGCTNDKDELLNPAGSDCTGVNASFANDVLPIIQANCGGCHGAGSTRGPGPLTNYTEIKNAAVRIKTSVITGSMPLNAAPLPDAAIRKIRCWVDSGTPNN